MKKEMFIGLLIITLLILTGCSDFTIECEIYYEDPMMFAKTVNSDYILCCREDGLSIEEDSCEKIPNNVGYP